MAKKVKKKPSVKDKRVSSFRTICEVHREIYDLVSKKGLLDVKISEQIIDLLEEAYAMAKKMNSKLSQYKHGYDDGWWEKERQNITKEKLRRRMI
jgi:hypothetical protein